MSSPPSLNADQRRAALAKAAEARRRRAELKDRLKAGEMSLPELLDLADADEVVGRMKAFSMIESLPGVGKIRTRRTMESLGISEKRRLRGLGPQQREALVRAFGRPGSTIS